MSSPTFIETERTVLIQLHPDNAHLLQAYQLANRAHLEPWEPARSDDFYTPENCHRRSEIAYRAFEDGVALHFMAIERQSQRMIAGCNFTNIVRGPLLGCHLGYSIDREHEGRGLMREIASAGIDHVFSVLGLHRIMANHAPRNLRSEQLLRRLGFEREGYAKAYLKIAGKWEDMVLNSLINPSN